MKIDAGGFRPGDLDGNTKQLLAYVKAAAKAGESKLTLPADAIRGGDCGSLDGHPAWKRMVAAAEQKFLKAVAKVKAAPRLVKGGKLKFRTVPKGDDERLPFCGHPDLVFACQVKGLVKRLKSMPWCHKVVIGISGGLDSALALLVAASAFEELGYDLQGIKVYTMPGFGTTQRTRGNADRLCEGLGLSLECIDITPACRQHFQDIGQDEHCHDVVFENTQARERTQILMDKANQFGGIVLGTGDLSEIALGWSTYNGDHMSMFAVNAGVPKTTIREVCRWWAENLGTEGRKVESAAALLDIIATPVSPELLPAKDGEIQQKTEDKIGPYELHDFFLWHFIAEQQGKADIAKAAKRAFKGEYDAATIEKWLALFFKRFFSQAFKRNCAPDGVQVFEVYLSLGAWHIPSDMVNVMQ